MGLENRPLSILDRSLPIVRLIAGFVSVVLVIVVVLPLVDHRRSFPSILSIRSPSLPTFASTASLRSGPVLTQRAMGASENRRSILRPAYQGRPPYQAPPSLPFRCTLCSLRPGLGCLSPRAKPVSDCTFEGWKCLGSCSLVPAMGLSLPRGQRGVSWCKCAT